MEGHRKTHQSSFSVKPSGRKVASGVYLKKIGTHDPKIVVPGEKEKRRPADVSFFLNIREAVLCLFFHSRAGRGC